jgi:putative copper export protein
LLPAAFIASALLILITVNRFATGTSVWSYLTTVRTGEYRGVQLVLTAVALVGADVLFLGTTARRRNVGVGLLIAATAGALFMSSLVSHSANAEGKFWSIASDFAHLVASSAWLGALIVLPLLLRWVRGRFEEAQRFLYLANVFDRFSILAAISVVVVIATGAFNGIAAVPTADAMVDTTYGRVLLAKLALLAPLLAIAGVNAFVLKPRLVSLIDGLYQEGGTTDERRRADWRRQLGRVQRALPWTIAVEVVLVVAVFAAVGVLSQTSTAEGEIAQKEAEQAGGERFTQTADRDGLKLTLEVSPNRVGINDYLVRAQRPDGADADTVERVRLRFTFDDPNSAVAPSELLLNRFGGNWQGQGAYFSQRGNWRVDVGIRRSDGDDVAQAFVLPVLPAASGAAVGGGTFDLPFTVFTWNEVVGVAMILLGALVVLYRRQLRWLAE